MKKPERIVVLKEPELDTWVIVPAFNEGKVIAQVLGELVQYPYKIVVVDDGSTDNTSEQALKFPIILLKHIYNLGQGAALQTGIEYALGFPQTQYIITFDSDGQHHITDIQKILRKIKQGYQVVLGSRFIQGGKTLNMPFQKKVVLTLAIWFSGWSNGMNLTDTHNGLRGFTRDAALKLHITQNGMAHASEILHFIKRQKLRYCEIPVTISYTAYSRLKGQSIYNSINILWDLLMEKLR